MRSALKALALLASLAANAACSGDNVISVYEDPELTDDDLDMVEQAADLWGLAVDWREAPGSNVIEVEFWDSSRIRFNKEIAGHASNLGCSSTKFRAMRDWRVVAHELGHIFGLGHVKDARNMMYENLFSSEPEIKSWQLGLVQSNAAALAALCESVEHNKVVEL